ncbi:MAG: helix-turn-helix domain-containing protein [Cycloclasticus sp.]
MDLLSRPRPYPDESFRGYVWRLTAENGYSSPASMLGILSTAYGHKVDMASLIRHNLQPLVAQALLNQRDRCSDRYILKGMFRVCFQCLESKPYLREVWDYALLPWCLEHETPLVSLGQVPLAALSEHYRLPHREVSNTTIEGQRLSQLIANSLSFIGHSPSDFPRELSNLDADRLQSLILLVGSYCEFGSRFQPRKFAIKESVDNAICILNAAGSVFLRWPTGLQHLVKFSESVNSRRSIARSVGYLYKAIHKEITSADMIFFTHAFDSYLVENWPDIIDKKSAWMGKFAHGQGLYEPGTLLAKRMHLTLSRLRFWVEQGFIDGHVICLQSGTKQVSVLKGQDNKVTSLISALTLDEVSKRLGLAKKCVRELLKRHLIEGVKSGLGAAWLIQEANLSEFMQVLRRGSGDTGSLSSYVSLDRLMRYHSGHMHTQADLVQASIDRAVIYILLGSTDLKNNLLIEGGSYKSWAIAPDLLSIPEAAKELRVKQEVMYHLVNKGFISVTNLGRVGRFITPESMNAFRCDYVFTSQLRNDHFLTARQIIQVLEKIGVKPVSGPSVDGGRQYLYKREDVACSSNFE